MAGSSSEEVIALMTVRINTLALIANNNEREGVAGCPSFAILGAQLLKLMIHHTMNLQPSRFRLPIV